MRARYVHTQGMLTQARIAACWHTPTLPKNTIGVWQHASPGSRFRRWVFFSLAMAVFVILFGAVVRITGSGAGCGQHWPTCEDTITRTPIPVTTLIEIAHRLTSGLLTILFFTLAVAAFKCFPRAHPTRTLASVSFGLLLVEGLVGMLLVRQGWVGANVSPARIGVTASHLVITLLLLGVTTASGFLCWPPQTEYQRNRTGALLVGVGLFAVVAIAASGAVTALGDSVRPPVADSAWAHWRSYHAGVGSTLQRIRILHPMIALPFLAVVLYALPRFRERGSRAAQFLARTSVLLFVGQACIGVANVTFFAPAALQVIHLFVSCLIWISLVLLALEFWSPRIPLGTSAAREGLGKLPRHEPQGSPRAVP